MKQIGVAILGATGTVGQKFITLLEDHPWFRIEELAASARSAGMQYRDACNWKQPTPIPDRVAGMTVRQAGDRLDSEVLFSGLDSAVAGELELHYAEAGHMIISNSRNHRMDTNVPLVIPEINCDHCALLKRQPWRGGIVTNPNCSTMFLAMVLAPLERRYGIRAVQVSTMQAISGAGYPGVASLDIIGNVVPHIDGEEHKMETETLKILGTLDEQGIKPATFAVSAQCNRVAVSDGHTETISIQFGDPDMRDAEASRAGSTRIGAQHIDTKSHSSSSATPVEVARTLAEFRGIPQEWQLPSAPRHPIVISDRPDRPQPLLDLWTEGGMATIVGRIRTCPVFDIKMVIMGHNTVRGAAGAAILNAEALYRLGHIGQGTAVSNR